MAKLGTSKGQVHTYVEYYCQRSATMFFFWRVRLVLEVGILVSNAYEHMDRYFLHRALVFLFLVLPYLFVLITYNYILPFDSERASFYPLGPVFS